jgi:hypothetical protein
VQVGEEPRSDDAVAELARQYAALKHEAKGEPKP